ncbi:hypothetical protein HPHPP15B_1648, partial [Helicobacter pylori Hp P-15b]
CTLKRGDNDVRIRAKKVKTSESFWEDKITIKWR